MRLRLDVLQLHFRCWWSCMVGLAWLKVLVYCKSIGGNIETLVMSTDSALCISAPSNGQMPLNCIWPRCSATHTVELSAHLVWAIENPLQNVQSISNMDSGLIAHLKGTIRILAFTHFLGGALDRMHQLLSEILASTQSGVKDIFSKIQIIQICWTISIRESISQEIFRLEIAFVELGHCVHRHSRPGTPRNKCYWVMKTRFWTLGPTVDWEREPSGRV